MQLQEDCSWRPPRRSALGTAPASRRVRRRRAEWPGRIAGEPNINGIWQAMNSANWNLEAHSAEALKEFWALGSLAAIPAGQSVVDGDGKIPYMPEALAQRDENRAGWPKTDPETKCYLPGIPRATYMPYPVPDHPRRRRHSVRLRVCEREPRGVHGQPSAAAGRHLDGVVERPLGRRDARRRDHGLQRHRPGSTAPATTTALRSR